MRGAAVIDALLLAPRPDPIPLKIGSLISTHDPLVSSRPRLDIQPGSAASRATKGTTEKLIPK